MGKEFEKYINKLVKDIYDYEALVSKFKKAEERVVFTSNTDEEYDALKKQIESLEDDKAWFFFEIDALYSKSFDNNYFYYDCSLQVYKNHFEQRFKDFKEYVFDANLLDFIKRELSIFNDPEKYKIIKQVNTGKHQLSVNYSEYFSSDDYRYTIAFDKKINFLSEKSKQFGFKVIIQEGDRYYNEYTGLYVNEDSYAELVALDKDEIVNSVSEKPNQLTTNQIVLLLQETEFFAHPKILDSHKTKQAKLISSITGLNEKNIKTAIEKLDKKPSKLTANYQKDIDKINQILNDLI